LTWIKLQIRACDIQIAFGSGLCHGVSRMPEKSSKKVSGLDTLPTAKDLLKEIARKEAAKATDSMQAATAEDAEKRELIERLSKPSGVSDEERINRAVAIIKRAADNGRTEVEVGRFPNVLCTDHGRAINQQEPGWEQTLTGVPKELYEFWREHLRPRGYKLKLQIVEFPGGMPGDIGISLSWS
jgi:hypothetical protein